jgi:PAS domain S-box-containing protein
MNGVISRALLIEDNPADAHFFGEMLRTAGAWQIQLTHVQTLGAALECLSSAEFDVALVDLSLPDACGIEAVVHLHGSFPSLPLVVLTDLDDEALGARAVREGAQDYLVKGQTDGPLILRAMRYASERRRAIDVLQRREEHFRSLIENALDLIAIVQTDGVVRYASPSHERILGWRPDELIGIDILSMIASEDHSAVRQALRCEGEPIPFAYRFRHKDGTWRLVESCARDLSHLPGVGGLVVNSRDITERQRTEDRLRNANLAMRTVVEASPLAIYSVNAEGTVRSWNSAARKLFGWKESEVLGRPLPAITAAGEPTVEWRLSQARDGRISAGPVTPGIDVVCQRFDGTTFDANLWSHVLRDVNGSLVGLIEIVADVSERKMLEQQVLQAQKMDAIARLAGGVAHDFNNLLTVISGYTHLLLGKLRPGDPAREDLEQVARAAERAGDLTRQLLAFSRRQLVRSSVVHIGAMIAEVEPILRRVAGEGVDLVTQVAPNLSPVCADPGQLEQVLLNLTLNARDAMPDGGALALEASAASLNEEAAALAGVQPGEYVVIRVCDTGIGMAAEVQARIFEPFFTTKEPGKGTGLGLSTSYGIIRQNNGNIRADSQPGRGTVFTVWLPVASSIAAANESGARTILVSEDEPGVRSVLEAMLRRLGHRVLACASAEEALDTIHRHDGEIDLLVTDVQLDGANGHELAGRIRAVRPLIRVLYISGHADSAAGAQGADDFLEKPFTPEALATRIRDVLSRPAGQAATPPG